MDSIILLDIDGTITDPRQRINDGMVSLLNEMKSKVHIGLISGSDLKQIENQPCLHGTKAIDLYEYVFSQNGLVAHHNGQLIHKADIVTYLGEKTLQEIINFTMITISELWLPFKRGMFIELRSGLINICPPGHTCNEEEREIFLEFNARNNILDDLSEMYKKRFPFLGQGRGGQISIDLFPLGWDKRLALKHLEGEAFKTIYFIGNKTDEGGNDYEIYHDSITRGFSTTGPEQTMDILKTILRELNGID